tara:strand:+ start:224 stop:472 length:249 start_codon:yes stop_codon:yes gene_type:complete
MASSVIEEGVVAFSLESQKAVTLEKSPSAGYKITFIAESSSESSVIGLANLQVSGKVVGTTLTINTSSPFTGNIYYYVSSIS